MFTQHLITSATLMGLSAAYVAPRTTPASDGFPDPNPQQLLSIEQQADGLLSNLPPPPQLSDAGITNFQLIAFNENLEVSFFDEIIKNITSHAPGFCSNSSAYSETALLEILTTVKAQEELHAITAINNLEHFNAPLVPEPCTYSFPVSNLEEAITLAETLTVVVLGTLQDAEQSFAQNGDDGPVRAVSSVIGQEGEQNGFYRSLLNLKPSEKPFLTTNVAAFAFSALQQFVVSCPFDVTQIPIPIFPPLQVLTTAEPRDMYLSFSADLSGNPNITEGSDFSDLFVTYLVGQQLPISEPIINPKFDSGVLTFDALFPFTENIMVGLSIASLTSSNNFANADALVADTLAAPGLIQVNEQLSV
ncbi:sexual development protein [Xylaria bambusicola]|uniref:sexual development protein n=1 Tax=Xylaria bambusicola TaxID=326684 RepID=UPI002008D9F9|nr:sexual development protein [Xylaria bambusicola]KAI0508885.1 sexual development protein [Xylaria bambusicola]